MNSEERRAARRKRREERRAKAKAERVKPCTLEAVADLNSLCEASKQAAGGVMWLDAHRSVLAMDALYHSLFENLAREGGGAQCRPTQGTIQAEASPRNSGEPATQSSGLSEAAAK